MKIWSLFRKQPYMKMFTRKRSNKGAFWASLISIGASAAVWGMTKGKMTKGNGNREERKNQPTGNMLTNLIGNRNIPMMNDAALTEFSEEIISKAVNNNNNIK
jgi:hypothetical protein